MLAIGIPFFLWGLIVLIPFRVLGQINQRRALVQQMAAVVLPAQTPEVRRTVLTKVMHALAEMPGEQRLNYMRAMQEAINEQPEEVRQVMTDTRVEILAELPSDKRRVLMQTMDKILFGI
jgi:predicted sugar kinase